MKKGLLLGLLLLFVFALPIKIVNAESMQPVDVTVKAYFDAENFLTAPLVEDVTYGSKVSFSGNIPTAPSGYESYVFYCWVVNGYVKMDLPVDHEFVVRGSMTISAIYKPANQYAVIFMDANSEAISVAYTTSGGTVSAPNVESYSKPGYVVSSTPWSGALTNITEDKILYLQYELDSEATYDVTVVNGTGSEADVPYGDVVTAVAAVDGGGLAFSHWVDENDKIVSYQSTHSFTVYKDTTITAVYEAEAPADVPYLVLSDPLDVRVGKSTFIGQFHVPSGYSLVEYGIVTSEVLGTYALDTENTTRYQSEKFNSLTNEFMLSFPYADREYIKAYLVVRDNSTEALSYHYSNVHLTSELMFSEYGEGSGNNKWYEIYNPTQGTIDLNGYFVKLHSDGSSTASYTLSFPENTLLEPGDVYVVANSSAVAAVLAYADVTSTTTYYNGDDALALFNGSTLVDIVGEIGVDPGSNWDGITNEKTLVRATDKPNSVWTVSEWAVHNQDTFGYVGFHEAVSPEEITISGATSLMAEKSMQLTLSFDPINSIRSVVWESSNESYATVDQHGLVTGVAEGVVTVQATSSVNGAVLDTHIISVTPAVYWGVTYYSNGGSAVDPDEVLDGNQATPPTPPTKTDYVFAGWYTDNTTFENLYNFSSPVTDDIDLYAKWEEEGGPVYASDLFISEYIEGSSNNKSIEIFNGTGSSVDLSVYTIKLNVNAYTYWGSPISLSGTLVHGETYVIANPSANTTILAIADLTSGTLSHNGDDAIGLFKNDVLIDIFGVFGEDPGSGWTIGATTNATADHTIVRAASAISPRTTWNTSDWIVYGNDVTSYLGSHTANVD